MAAVSSGVREHQHSHLTFGGEGSDIGQFLGPNGVTVSDEGDVFVADFYNMRVQVFTLQGTFVRQFPTVVSGEQKMGPHDLANDGEENLWVVGRTESAECVVQYTRQGTVLRKIDLQDISEESVITGWGRGLAVDTRKNHILITQTTGNYPNLHSEVLVFKPDGTLVITVGSQQGMKYLVHIAVDVDGNILVSDHDSHSVFVYSEDGQFMFKFGSEGSGEGQLSWPSGICTDRAGNIVVADNGNFRVELFDKSGRFLKHITTELDFLKRPWAVAMATQGQLVVTGASKHTVTIFPNF